MNTKNNLCSFFNYNTSQTEDLLPDDGTKEWFRKFGKKEKEDHDDVEEKKYIPRHLFLFVRSLAFFLFIQLFIKCTCDE